MQSMIELICDCCGSSFSRRTSEHNRNQKLGRGIFCGLKCIGKTYNAHLPRWTVHTAPRPDNLLDEFSDFRYYMKIIKARSTKKNRPTDIDLLYLKALWDKQQGICPYTGQLMILQLHSQKNVLVTPYTASLDRIDNSKGYIRGNLEFVSWMANVAKNKLSRQDLIEFCKKVAEFHKDTELCQS